MNENNTKNPPCKNEECENYDSDFKSCCFLHTLRSLKSCKKYEDYNDKQRKIHQNSDITERS